MKKTTAPARRPAANTAAPLDAQQLITNRIMEALEGGIIPWRKPWNVVYGLPKNYATGRVYTGINVFLLHFSGALPFFLTYKQAQELGGHVRKGAKGHQVIYYNTTTKEDAQTGKEKKIPFMRYYTVFSVEDIEGIEFNLPKVEEQEFTPIEAAQRIVEGWEGRPAIQHLHQRAYYAPDLDFVNMPKPETFINSESYYRVLFHELTHSTGHAARLNRPDLTAREGKQSASYAREELTAEMGAALLSGAAGITTEQTEENTVAYIQNWLGRLKNDKTLVIKAASKAQRALELILGHQGDEEAQGDEQEQPAPAMVATTTATPQAPRFSDDTEREFFRAEMFWTLQNEEAEEAPVALAA